VIYLQENDVPKILEGPIDERGDDVENMMRVRQLVSSHLVI